MALVVEGEVEEAAVEVVDDSNILMEVDQAIIKDAEVVVVEVEEDQTFIIHQQYQMGSNHYLASAFITQEMAVAVMAIHAGRNFYVEVMPKDHSNVLRWFQNSLESWHQLNLVLCS